MKRSAQNEAASPGLSMTGTDTPGLLQGFALLHKVTPQQEAIVGVRLGCYATAATAVLAMVTRPAGGATNLGEALQDLTDLTGQPDDTSGQHRKASGFAPKQCRPTEGICHPPARVYWDADRCVRAGSPAPGHRAARNRCSTQTRPAMADTFEAGRITIMKRTIAAAMLALGLLGATGPANASATLSVPTCRLFTAKDFRDVFHRPPSAIKSEGRRKCTYFFDAGHQQALLVQARHSRITARFHPRHLYSSRKLAAVEKRAQRHLGNSTTQGGSKWESYINQNHWGLIVALCALLIAFIAIGEMMHRRRTRRRAATAVVSRPVAPPQPYTPNPADMPTREEWEEIHRQQRKERDRLLRNYERDKNRRR
jgi:hypothetical protein